MVAEYSLNISVYGTDSSEAGEAQPTGARLRFIYAPRFSYRFFGQHGAPLACVLHALLIARPRVILLFASGPSVFVPLFRLMGKPVVKYCKRGSILLGSIRLLSPPTAWK